MEKQHSSQTSEASLGLRVFSRLHSEMHVQSPIVLGRENLLNLPQDKGVVIAPTHLSDIDVETAIADISKYRDIAVTVQMKWLKHPFVGSVMRLVAGEKNIHGVTGRFNVESGHPEYKINPDDFEKMKTSLEKGLAVILPAHVPSYGWQLPGSPGFGAVFLVQQLPEPVVLPVAVDIDSQSGKINAAIANDYVGSLKRFVTRKRPSSRLTYGKPIRFEKIQQQDLDLVLKLFKASERHNLSEEDKLKAMVVLGKIKGQGIVLTNAIADLLPPEKRGKWGIR